MMYDTLRSPRRDKELLSFGLIGPHLLVTLGRCARQCSVSCNANLVRDVVVDRVREGLNAFTSEEAKSYILIISPILSEMCDVKVITASGRPSAEATTLISWSSDSLFEKKHQCNHGFDLFRSPGPVAVVEGRTLEKGGRLIQSPESV